VLVAEEPVRGIGAAVLQIRISPVPGLLHMIWDTAFWGENVKPSIESIIRRPVRLGARVVYHARRRYVYVASAFPLDYASLH
jgi:hypothetical protein